jgi:hypothetical protein
VGYRENPLNLIRVMPAKGQDLVPTASTPTSLFLARLIGPVFVAVGLGALVHVGYRETVEEFLRSAALIYLSGLLGMTAGIAVILTHNVWAADWRVLITLFGWLAAIGGAVRVILPQLLESAGHWFLAHPASMTVAGIVWLVIGALLCFFGYFREGKG